MFLYVFDAVLLGLLLCSDVLCNPETDPDYAQKTVKAFTGKTITFDCNAPDIQPGDVITWYHEDLRISNGGSIIEDELSERFSISVFNTYYNLTIMELEIEDEGEYECIRERSGTDPVLLRTRTLLVSENESAAPFDVFAILGLLSGILLIVGIVGAIAWKYGRDRGEMEAREDIES